MNKYKFIKKIVKGSASTIYLAQDENDKNVIIKKIPKNEEWKSELNILKKLPKDDKILNFIDYFLLERNVYLITSYYKGFDLFEHIDINVPYEEELAKKIILEMAKCIKICHDNLIAHLDIKCENFMVCTYNPFPKLILIDFGHAEKIQENKIIDANFRYGTCYYLCPEGYSRKYSLWSDIWSLGICSHLILSGKYPYRENKSYKKSIINGNLKYCEKKISEKSKIFLEGMLKLNPEERFNIDEVINNKYLMR